MNRNPVTLGGALALVCWSACAAHVGDDPADPRGGEVEQGEGELCEGPLAVQPVILDCDVESGYQVDSWRADSVEGPALHLAAIYQTHGEHGGGVHPPGDALVEWKLAGEHVLALSAYEPVNWTITLAPGAALQKIVVFGYHEQTVTAPEGIKIETFYYEGGLQDPLASCGYSLPYNGQGCDTDVLIANAEQATGLKLASFDGCYDASQFRFEGCGGLEPPREPEECAPAADPEVILDCDFASGYEINSWRADAVDGPAVHVIGIYDVDSHNPGQPVEEAEVEFDLPGDNILVLSAYEPTIWKVALGPQASLSKVVVIGYLDQQVKVDDSVPVEIYEADSPLAACGYSLPYNGGGCDTEVLLANAAAIVGHPVTAFDGCYDAGLFRIAGDASSCEPPPQ